MINDNLEYALKTWNENLAKITAMLTQSPEEYSSEIWDIVATISDVLIAIGLGLVVVFFLMGVVKSTASFAEFKRPELVVKTLLRLGIAKTIVTHGLTIMSGIFEIIRGITRTILADPQIELVLDTITVPEKITEAAGNLKFLESILAWALTFIGAIVIVVLSFIMIMSVYSRFFKLYIYSAIAAIPLSTFAGEPTSMVGKSFIKSYAGVCLEGLIIVVACLIFGAFASKPPDLNESSAAALLWSYLGHTIFNFLILALTVKTSDRVCREMLGL